MGKVKGGDFGEMEFRYLVYRERELEREGQIGEDLRRVFGRVRRFGVSVTEIGELGLGEYLLGQGILAEDVLVLAAGDGTISEAAELSAAVLGYRNPDFSEEELYGADFLVEGFWEIDYYFLERVYQRKHGIPWRVIETKRCYLREMTLSDLPDLYELYAGEGMTKYMEPLYDWEQETEYTKAYIQNMYRFYGYGMWLVKDRMTHRLIGRAGLEHCDLEGECLLEMGYAVGVSYQRMGYAEEVCRAVIEYAGGAELGFDKIYCFVWEGNEASVALLHKLGFEFEGNCVRDGRKMQKYVWKII